jgi:biotin carboxyl carrier protein
MKMEHHVTAPADGLVEEILVAVGSQVETGATLLVFTADEPVGEGS